MRSLHAGNRIGSPRCVDKSSTCLNRVVDRADQLSRSRRTCLKFTVPKRGSRHISDAMEEPLSGPCPSEAECPRCGAEQSFCRRDEVAQRQPRNAPPFFRARRAHAAISFSFALNNCAAAIGRCTERDRPSASNAVLRSKHHVSKVPPSRHDQRAQERRAAHRAKVRPLAAASRRQYALI